MSLEALKTNIAHEKELLSEIILFIEQYKKRQSPYEEKSILNTIKSLERQLAILNDSVPALLKNITLVRELPSERKIAEREKAKLEAQKKPEEKLVSLSYIDKDKERKSTIVKDADKEKFIRELGIHESLVKRLKAEKGIKETEGIGLAEKKVGRKPSIFARLSNKFFSNFSNNLSAKGYFKDLNENLKKASMPFIINTYVSMIFFSVLLAFLIAIMVVVLLLVLNVQMAVKLIWIILVLPLLAFTAFYFYPSSEKKSVSKKINDELSFVAIHMSAIAGSGLEPTNIFKIVTQSRENPYTAREIKKLLNLINFYGMDLVSALRDSAKSCPNKKLTDLFNGLATTISTGGSLSEFLDKRAETLLFDYKMEKEKYTNAAETFMNIYISIALAAPLMLVLLVVMMNMSGIGLGMGINLLTIIIVSVIAFINSIFLVFLHLKYQGF